MHRVLHVTCLAGHARREEVRIQHRFRRLRVTMTTGKRLILAVTVLDSEFGRVLRRLSIRELNKVNRRILGVLWRLSREGRLIRVGAINVRDELCRILVAVLVHRDERNGHVLPLLRARHVRVPL